MGKGSSVDTPENSQPVNIELLNEIHGELVQRVQWKIDRLTPHSKEQVLENQ
jgi:hypothetical protein